LEVSDLLRRLEEGDELIMKMREEYDTKIEYLQQESEQAADTLQTSFRKREDEVL
jgi:hypothetical protein